MTSSHRLEAVSEVEWDRFAAEAGAPLFSRSTWGKVCREGLGGRPIYLVLKDRGGSPRAGMPGLVLRALGVQSYYSMYPYGGPIGDEGLFAETVVRAERALKAMGVHLVRLTLPPASIIHLPGHRRTTLPQHSLPLGKGGAAVPYRARLRRDVRRAIRSGARVETLAGEGGTEEFYRLYLLSMERNRAPARLPLSFFRAVDRRLRPTGEAALFATRVRGSPAAAICVVFAGGIAHALSQGSDPRFHRFRPTDLLIHYCLADAASRGMKEFDFMASPGRDRPLIEYKEKWGALRGEAITLDRHLHPILGPALAVARRLIQVPVLAGLTRAIRRCAS